MTSNERTLNLYPIDYPFETLVARIKASPPKTILDPDFQRKYKWDEEGWQRASKFIESCLMRIPLPSCYFAENESGHHLVIDGVQRLTTIKRFFDDEFALEGMTAFDDLEGKRFSELGDYRSELESTTIRCIVLRKDNPKSIIREIFSRLNQGAVRLSDQEIRHAIFPGSLDALLEELGQAPEIARFGLAKDSTSAKTSREPDEQVLRFFAFSEDHDLSKYGGVLSAYLDAFMADNQCIDADRVSALRTKFTGALDNCRLIFGERMFTKASAERPRQGLVYYDLLMPTVGLLDRELVTSKQSKIRAAFERLCDAPEFTRTLSGGLQNKSSIIKRREIWSMLLREALDK